MDNSTNKPLELTDYDIQDMRKVAYAHYSDLIQKRDERHEREAQWDAHHRLGPIARWVVNKVRTFHDRLEEEEIQDAIDLADPMAGFTRCKQQHAKP